MVFFIIRVTDTTVNWGVIALFIGANYGFFTPDQQDNLYFCA